MENFALVTSILLPFLVVIGALHQALNRWLARGKLSRFSAIAIMWTAVLGLPTVITWCVVPMWFKLYTSQPYLQSAAWDIRLATMTHIGMIIAFLCGAAGGCFATWQYASYGR
ncbi:hypothetical protein RY831_04485 [Noviherbaspirillum sp. CPCC 100848]|uniref:Uncharacterized protein n=1 Tax=Noviherbaspirillum album TaxID=3080276 RepID=A0ABU6J4S3_9BURK|nr:hypothetical protein [Noviherbaspirillum sp. CPCC 100848]MEC4718390.1 hypothetical protein [Noviherbaspirillum sp. CPCC 100848]